MVRATLRLGTTEQFCDYRVNLFDCIPSQSKVISSIGWFTFVVLLLSTIACVVAIVYILYKKQKITWFIRPGMLTPFAHNLLRFIANFIGLIHYSLLLTNGYGDGHYAAREVMWALFCIVTLSASNQSSAAAMVASNHITRNLNIQLSTSSSNSMILWTWIATLVGVPSVFLAIGTGYYHNIGNDRMETIFFLLSQTSIVLCTIMSVGQRLIFMLKLSYQLKKRSAGADDVEAVRQRLLLQTIVYLMLSLIALPPFAMEAYWHLVFQNTIFQGYVAVCVTIGFPFFILIMVVSSLFRPIPTSKHSGSTSDGHARVSDVKMQSNPVSDPFK